MAILALDTCFGGCSAALLFPDRSGKDRIFERFEIIGRGHSEVLLGLVRSVMTAAGARYTEVETIAVTVGPGSFTGTRVGVAAARSLALAIGADLCGITSLEAMRRRARLELGAASDVSFEADGDETLVAIDARRNQIYILHPSTNTYLHTRPQIVSLEEAAEIALQGFLIVGSGGPMISQELAEKNLTARTALHDLVPHAGDVAEIVAQGLEAVPVRVFDPVKPIYLRPPDAKPQVGPNLVTR